METGRQHRSDIACNWEVKKEEVGREEQKTEKERQRTK